MKSKTRLKTIRVKICGSEVTLSRKTNLNKEYPYEFYVKKTFLVIGYALSIDILTNSPTISMTDKAKEESFFFHCHSIDLKN